MKTHAIFKKLILGLAVAACVGGMCAPAIAAPETAPTADTGAKNAVPHQSKGKLSLIEVAPELYYTAMRYSKFYGDANTTHGNILERGYLLGNPGGDRDYLIDHGF